jgi:hypothetical protein
MTEKPRKATPSAPHNTSRRSPKLRRNSRPDQNPVYNANGPFLLTVIGIIHNLYINIFKNGQLDQGLLKGNDNDMQVTFNMCATVRLTN